MADFLAEALKILRNTEANDSRVKARGRRAHARVLTMISLSEHTGRLVLEQRIANLLTLAQMDANSADWALREARGLLREDELADRSAG